MILILLSAYSGLIISLTEYAVLKWGHVPSTVMKSFVYKEMPFEFYLN